MVTKSAVTVMPPRAVARSKATTPASIGLALINKLLDANVGRALVDSERFTRQVQDAEMSHLEFGQVKALHRMWLPNMVRAVETDIILSDMVSPHEPLMQADATMMLNYLFGAMGKRRNGEAQAKLMACVDIFSPVSNALGSALGLWQPVPTHPAILAIAVKQLMAQKTFEPAEAELREALGKVKQLLSARQGWLWRWIEKLDELDEEVFKGDCPAWDEAYANVSREVVLAMRERVELAGDGPSEDADEEYQPSPRWQALDDLVKAKARIPKSEPREAACAAKAAKRARKPKPIEADHAGE
jgi:hypothetical protein